MFQKIFIIALQLLLLLVTAAAASAFTCVSMLYATVEEMVVVTTSDAEKLVEALLCDGPERFSVSWHGDIMVSLTLSVSNGITLDVAGFSESADNADTGAAVISDGSILTLHYFPS